MQQKCRRNGLSGSLALEVAVEDRQSEHQSLAWVSLPPPVIAFAMENILSPRSDMQTINTTSYNYLFVN